jgi:hypothetical protein
VPTRSFSVIALTVTLVAILATTNLLLPAAADSPAAAPDRAREIGQQASQALQKQLGGALMQALGEGGPAAAVAVCADTAQVLTSRIARELEVPGLELKRTSLHLRNPANRPDSLEVAVLGAYTAELASGEPPEPRLEAVGDRYRYFAPIETRSLCLRCHGPADRLAEGVPAILAERYPQDEATGHAQGDLRGIVSVTIPAAAATP